MEIIKFKNIILNIPKRYYNDVIKNRFINDIYETYELYFVNKYFDKNDYVLELGSCLGFISFTLAKIVKHVISIEANPELENSLLSSQKMNNINNIDFHNCFISNDTKNIKFQTYDLITAGSGNRPRETVGNILNTLKEYELKPRNIKSINNINKVNSIILDIEGGELNFFIENKELLKKCNKILAEFHQKLMNIPGFEKKCINILNSYDFILKEMKGGNFYFEKKSFINLKLKPEQKPELKPELKPIKKPEVKPEKKTELKPIKKQEQSNQLINLLINNANKKKQFIKKY
jgi:FkbM family methyltransferase